MSEYDATKDRHELLKDLTSKAYVSQVDYGRWVLASLITMHGGAIFALMQTSDKFPRSLMVACMPILVCGLLLAILTGALAWINFTIAAQGYVKMLVSLINGAPKELSKRAVWGSRISMWLAVFTATGSLVCFAWAATSGYAVLNTIP